MDLLRLDQNFVPNTLIEGYESLIWTERFRNHGEFQLKTNRVSATQAALPEGALISLRDSSEVMMVEAHSLKYTEGQKRTLIVTGRTFETFLENRAQFGPVYKEPWRPLVAYTNEMYILMLLWNHMVNPTDQDPTFVGTKDPLTAVPNVVVTSSSTMNSIVEDWTFEEGVVYAMLRRYLDFGDLGVRNIRPLNTDGLVVSFDVSAGAGRGGPIAAQVSGITQLRMDVFHGTDRTRHQSAVEPVIFHYESGHIDDPEYFMSLKDQKHMAAVSTSIGRGAVWPNTTPPPDTTVSGLNRRILYFDGGTKAEESDQEAFIQNVTQNAYVELSKHPHAVLFDGGVSAMAPYEYNKDYFLGDRVTLMGEYGFEESMVISEFVRTQDTNGDVGYPGLVRKEEYDVTKKRVIEGLHA